ncbi:DUF3018 family protein [Salmonella enterica]|nr:DUF3018 family protein [Salmonella enterica]
MVIERYCLVSAKIEQAESNWLALCCRGVVDECRRQAGIVAQADARDETTSVLDESAADVDGWDG